MSLCMRFIRFIKFIRFPGNKGQFYFFPEIILNLRSLSQNGYFNFDFVYIYI